MNQRPGYNSEKNRNESFGLSLDNAKTLAEKIYAALLNLGPMTAEQIGRIVRNPRVYVIHARLNELMKEGLVRDSECKRINSETGMPNTVWEAIVNEPTLF